MVEKVHREKEYSFSLIKLKGNSGICRWEQIPHLFNYPDNLLVSTLGVYRHLAIYFKEREEPRLFMKVFLIRIGLIMTTIVTITLLDSLY